jgi:hypothetical protein
MKKRAKWGSVKEWVYALKIGESFFVTGQKAATNLNSIAHRHRIYLRQENQMRGRNVPRNECVFKITRLR